MAEEPTRELDRERAARVAAQELVATLEARLLEAEQRLARIGELELELREVTTGYHAELERVLSLNRGMAGSLSWRVTRPLRWAKHRRG